MKSVESLARRCDRAVVRRPSPAGGVVCVAEAESAAHNLTGQVEDGEVIVQDEIGVGGQDDPVQLESEPTGIIVGGKFLLRDGGGGEAAEQVDERALEVGDTASS